MSTAVAIAYIDAHQERFGVEPICRVLRDAGVQIAPSTYYAARTRPPSARSISDAATTKVIAKVHADNYGVYGVTKVHPELRRQGHRVARCTVHRLMRAAGLRGIILSHDGSGGSFHSTEGQKSWQHGRRTRTSCVSAPPG